MTLNRDEIDPSRARWLDTQFGCPECNNNGEAPACQVDDGPNGRLEGPE